MSEERKEEQKCFCQSKTFRNFLTIALGTFVGVYCALCLFAAMHRPPMMPQPCPCMMGYRHAPMAVRMPVSHHRHHINDVQKRDGETQKSIRYRDMAPFDNAKKD